MDHEMNGIRKRIREAKVKQWQVAKACRVAESTFIRWLRDEDTMSDEHKQMIYRAIEEAKKGGATNG